MATCPPATAAPPTPTPLTAPVATRPLSTRTLDNVDTVADLVGELAGSPASRTDQQSQVREQIRSALAAKQSAGGQSSRGRNERRRESRRPYPYPIYLTPVADDGRTPRGEHIVVLGKHLSELGLDFYHREPLPYRRMIASIEVSDGRWMGILMDLAWCRFTRHGWYDNGGKFLSVVASPLTHLPTLAASR